VRDSWFISEQVAQQDAERSKWIVEKALEEKKSIIIAAQARQSARLHLCTIEGAERKTSVNAA
jgi:hypothetical protein